MKMKLWNEKLMHVLPSWKKCELMKLMRIFSIFSPTHSIYVFSPAAALHISHYDNLRDSLSCRGLINWWDIIVITIIAHQSIEYLIFQLLHFFICQSILLTFFNILGYLDGWRDLIARGRFGTISSRFFVLFTVTAIYVDFFVSCWWDRCSLWCCRWRFIALTVGWRCFSWGGIFSGGSSHWTTCYFL